MWYSCRILSCTYACTSLSLLYKHQIYHHKMNKTVKNRNISKQENWITYSDPICRHNLMQQMHIK